MEIKVPVETKVIYLNRFNRFNKTLKIETFKYLIVSKNQEVIKCNSLTTILFTMPA